MRVSRVRRRTRERERAMHSSDSRAKTMFLSREKIIFVKCHSIKPDSNGETKENIKASWVHTDNCRMTCSSIHSIALFGYSMTEEKKKRRREKLPSKLLSSSSRLKNPAVARKEKCANERKKRWLRDQVKTPENELERALSFATRHSF